MKPTREIDIALAITKRDGKLLLIQRKHPLSLWDHKWEFPGGKIEADESHEEAVRRELKEETGLSCVKADFLCSHTHDWHLPEGGILRVHLFCFACEAGGEDVVIETEKAYDKVWVDPQVALRYDLLEANYTILKDFYLPFHAPPTNLGRN